MPLNEAYPAERNRRILELAGPDAVLADAGQDASFADGTGVPVVRIGADDVARTLRERGPAPALAGEPGDPDAM
ncbi:hypothetical protein ABZ128_29645 [Streptomyces sp. NPDC006326]|uniref:hypothetical protein n=1 Tax=Streptomyces sp. NPDC006326 TaxID=3156752 RepID=UPI0033A6E4B6